MVGRCEVIKGRQQLQAARIEIRACDRCTRTVDVGVGPMLPGQKSVRERASDDLAAAEREKDGCIKPDVFLAAYKMRPRSHLCVFIKSGK